MTRPGPRLLHSRYIQSLTDRQLYTEESVIVHAKNLEIFSPLDDERKAKQRLRRLMKQKSFPPEGDGQIEDAFGVLRRAYYGARLKVQLPEGYISESERQESRAILDELLRQGAPPVQRYVQTLKDPAEEKWTLLTNRLDAMERSLEAGIRQIAALVQSRESVGLSPGVTSGSGEPPDSSAVQRSSGQKKASFEGGARRRLRRIPNWAFFSGWRWLLPILTVSLVALYAFQKTGLDIPLTGQPRIGVLYCLTDSAGSTFAGAVATAFTASRTMRPISSVRVEKAGKTARFCEAPDNRQLAAAAAVLRADFLVWGKVTRRKGAYVYRGLLYSDGVSIPLRVKSASPLHLPDLVAQRCLALLNYAETSISTAHFYSQNEKARLLYGEARLLYERGDVSAAKALYKQAFIYDPAFAKAKIDYARCQYVAGDFTGAIETLEALLSDDDSQELHRDLRTEAYRRIASAYYINADFEKLAPLLIEARARTRDHNDRAYLFFTRLEAKLAYVEGRKQEAEAFAREVVELARQIDDPEATVGALRTRARLFYDKRRYQEALATLRDSQAIAASNELISEQIEVIAQITMVLIKSGDEPQLEAHLANLNAAVKTARTKGSAVDATKIEYWLGVAQKTLGRWEEGRAWLERALQEAERIGDWHTRIKALSILAQDLIDEGLFVQAAILLEPLQDQLNSLPPQFACLIYDRVYRIHYHLGEYAAAIDALDRLADLARVARDKSILAQSLYDKAIILKSTGDESQVEPLLLESLSANPEPNRVTVMAMRCLIELYQSRGDLDQARKWREQLNKTGL